MYWSNYELKSRAREKLRGRWGQYLAVGAIFLVLTSLFEIVCDLLSLPGPMELLLWGYRQMAEEMLAASGLTMNDLFAASGDAYSREVLQLLFNVQLSAGQVTGILVRQLVNLFLTIFCYQVLSLGLYRWLMEARGGHPGISTLFSGFANLQQWLNVVWVLFYTSLVSALLSLLFVIPGVIYAYQVILTPWLLAENPYLSRRRAVQLSKTLTQREKARIFWLQLSFIGWAILSSMAESIATTITPPLGVVVGLVGGLLLMIYRTATMAELYAAMREKAFQMGYSDASELAGFAA